MLSVVTGAGRGLGRQIALALARRGDTVALLARSSAQLDDVRREIESAGGRARGFAVDVSDPEQVLSVAGAIAMDLGEPSALVNAAGVFGPIQLIKQSDPDEWLKTISVNLAGPFLTCRWFVPAMLKNGWGRIVNVSSAAAFHTPGPLNSAYATSKVALNQFTRHLATELAGTGVTANAIHPGEVKTEMWADIRDQAKSLGPEADGYRKWVDWVGQTGGDDPQKAADLVLKLTSRDSSPDVNGQFLWIENGLQTPIKTW